MMGSALAIAAAVRSGATSAREVAQVALDRIVAQNPLQLCTSAHLSNAA